jgi:hypothetical protein
MNALGAFVPQPIAAAAEGGPADLVTTSSIAAALILLGALGIAFLPRQRHWQPAASTVQEPG